MTMIVMGAFCANPGDRGGLNKIAGRTLRVTGEWLPARCHMMAIRGTLRGWCLHPQRHKQPRTSSPFLQHSCFFTFYLPTYLRMYCLVPAAGECGAWAV